MRRNKVLSLRDLLINAERMISLPPVGLTVPLWQWIIWNLWKARNKLCFDDRLFTGLEVVHKAIKDAKEWQDAQSSGVGSGSTSAPQRQARLHINGAPGASISGPVCHVDAAWNPNSRNGGFGGIFFDHIHPPLPIIRQSQRFISSALMAECLPVRFAVMAAASSNRQSLTVLSDSQILIKLLKTKESRPALFGILGDIYHFSKAFVAISFIFIPLLQNSDADSVAKTALAMVDTPSLDGN